jgi:hypothetical protein
VGLKKGVIFDVILDPALLEQIENGKNLPFLLKLNFAALVLLNRGTQFTQYPCWKL